MAKKPGFFKSSISYKIVAMFVLLTVSIIIVTGTFMINRIDQFYHDDFNTLMSSVFNEDYQRLLSSKTVEEDSFEQIKASIDAYAGQLGIDSFRHYYILNGRTGKAIFGTNPGLAQTLEASPNIIAAMRGRIGDMSKPKTGYMDYAIPVKNQDATEYIIYIKDSKEEIDSIVKNILSIIFMALALGLIISFAFGILLSKTIISPISSLTKKAQKITSGDFLHKLDVKSGDEIGQLTQTFNDMAVELNSTLTQIQSEKDKVETILRYMADGVMAFDASGNIIHINPEARKMMNTPRIEKLKFDDIFKEYDLTLTQILFADIYSPMEREIKKGNIEIKLFFARFKTGKKNGGIVVVLQDITERQKLDNARREFVANVSHELRTPLTTIKGYTETLISEIEDSDCAPKSFITYLNVINNESDRMARLVRDLLTLSKLDYSQKGIKKEVFDLGALVEHIVEKMRITAKANKQNLVFEVSNRITDFLGDRDSIEQVMVNVISNALKYTLENGTIHVSIGQIYQNCYIKIRDNGIGIPKEDVPHIFERFYRVDKARSREQGGTGLGLAISKDIINAHGGTITITSDYGKGTEVIIMFPLNGAKSPDIKTKEHKKPSKKQNN